jgi:alpha-ketoglutarate-dependent 2,4-dichlorophenoxyacetate dioxygenase
MGIEIRQLHSVFVGEVSGVDISRPLDPETVRAIDDAINRYSILIFHDQALDDERHIAFARNFGTPEVSINSIRPGNRSSAIPNIVSDITNLDENSKPRGWTDRRRLFSLANRMWHTDSSFRPIPAAVSMLYARDVPPKEEGGETEFADLRAAYDALPAKMQAMARELLAEHSLLYSRTQLGFDDFSPEEVAAWPPVAQRVARRHPGSGRATLYLGCHASHIVGWPIPEGRIFLRDLTEFATQPQFVYAHSWTKGDLVIWDNRCTMHRGRHYDPAYPRDFRRVTTSDISSTIEQAA